MKRVIRLTESELHRIIEKAVANVITEEGEGGAIGGGATGTNTVGGPTTKYQFDVPFGSPIKRNDHFYEPAMKRDRKKGISMNRLGGEDEDDD